MRDGKMQPMLNTAQFRPDSTDWFTSTRTNNGNQCVEVRFDGDAVLIRDSKFRRNPAHCGRPEPVITVTAADWMSFLATVQSHPTDPSPLTAHPSLDGGAILRHGEISLVYTPGEWAAFVAGVRDGEFDRIALNA
ncbi:MAG: hypothetical protein JWN03_1110 [Nocardia sp.]|uniref:DUF397 domain-containing protein n=1 Tax=Nocardia sp. TaxID=1821 RepID=UPI00261570DE|nr:DUF397 domain-containing protein [Nocardia sp.]MCU1640835.1 hypothetical protein [Nocardia sp.]